MLDTCEVSTAAKDTPDFGFSRSRKEPAMKGTEGQFLLVIECGEST
jgi:hypothetical protein